MQIKVLLPPPRRVIVQVIAFYRSRTSIAAIVGDRKHRRSVGGGGVGGCRTCEGEEERGETYRLIGDPTHPPRCADAMG